MNLELLIEILNRFFFFFLRNCNKIVIETEITNKCSSNVLLENENGKLNAVICDFGLARVEEMKVFFCFCFFFCFLLYLTLFFLLLLSFFFILVKKKILRFTTKK